jgi:hypothetical protein
VADQVKTLDLNRAVGKQEELAHFPVGIHEADDAKGLPDLVAVVPLALESHAAAAVVASPAVLVLLSYPLSRNEPDLALKGQRCLGVDL